MEFTHNNRRHADRQRTPFELIMGMAPISIPSSFENTKFPAIEERLKNLTKDREEALAAHEFARQRMIERRKDRFIPFRKGQMVWLDSRHLKTNYHTKMAPKREGPFEILEVKGPLTYKLKLPETWRIHDTFHATLLMPYIETETHGPNYTRPPPDIDNEEERYEIETILKHQRRGRGYRYFVLWKGYPVTEATWEPSSSFEQGGENILKEYQTRLNLQ